MLNTSPYNGKYSALYRGVVVENQDPEHLGRCKIRVPFVHGELTFPIDLIPWARPIVLSPVKKGRGAINLPDVNDIVWVFFEGANRDYPVYIGGTYARGEVDALPDIVTFYLEDEDNITYDRLNRIYDINIGDRHITVTPESIHIKGDTIIEGNLDVTGFIHADDVYGDNTSLHNHTHGGVYSGANNTESPN